MGNNFTEFRLQLVDTRRKRPIDDNVGVFAVLNHGTAVKSTLYADRYGAVRSNPAPLVNGAIRFFMDSTVETVDLSVMTEWGESAILTSVSRSMGRVDINPEQRHYVMGVPFGASDAVETDIGFDLPANLFIQNTFLKVLAIDAGETVNVGTLLGEAGGDADILVPAASLATLGYVAGGLVAPFMTNGIAKSLTFAGSAGSDTGAGIVFIEYLKLI